MKCMKANCNWEGTPNLEETGPHTKATCPKCGSYIKFVSAKELEEIIGKRTKSPEEAVSMSQIRRLRIQKGIRNESE